MDPDAWRAELTLHAELFETLARGLPEVLKDAREALEARL